MFVWKYYIGWNKLGIIIKFKSTFGKRIQFSEIGTIEFSSATLNIKKKDGNRLIFDLTEIRESDVKKLSNILTKNTVTNNG